MGAAQIDPLNNALPSAHLFDASTLGDVLKNDADLARQTLLRQTRIASLLQLHPDVLEADPHGAVIVRHEILAWSPSPAGLAAAHAAGLLVTRESNFDGLALTVLRLADTAQTAAILAMLRTIDPEGIYDFNHIYLNSAASNTVERPPAGAGPDAGSGNPLRHQGAAIRIGLIDSGVDASHSVFHASLVHQWGCNDTPHPAMHGTAVAALMVGQSERFRGVVPGAILYAADIYCDSATGGSAEQIAQALAWFAREKVAVINLSLVGPPNQALERMVAAMVRRGHLLVAAVGNDGPAAAALFPASYPGVVGVSAVDPKRQPLPEAGRGPQVMFAAPGSNMMSAAIGSPAYRQVRGTSFAAPIVAALLASRLDQPDPAGARKAIATLAKQAAGNNAISDTVSNTTSEATGYGVVGEAFRTNPSQFQAF